MEEVICFAEDIGKEWANTRRDTVTVSLTIAIHPAQAGAGNSEKTVGSGQPESFLTCSSLSPKRDLGPCFGNKIVQATIGVR